MFLENVEKVLQSWGGGGGLEKVGRVTANTTLFFA